MGIRQEARPRFGATLESVKRRLTPTLVPRARKAPDGKCKVVTNPRISAGSTVDVAGPASCLYLFQLLIQERSGAV